MTLPILLCVLGASGAWGTNPVVRLAEHGVLVRTADGDPFPEAMATELWEGLRVLPERFRRVPGRPLVIELRGTPAPFGMGDGSPALPDWLDDGGTFVLYAWETSDDRRATYRLEALAPTDRERLWRRRAIVHAVLRRWNDRYRWSEREAWARISGWEGPRNEYLWAYSRARGAESAAMDLLTFAEEALLPVESLDPAALAVDDRVRCQEFSKSRFLAQVLGIDAIIARPRECPAFDRWADLENLSHIEVLLSAPSGQRLQSLFGHLLIRPVYRNDAVRMRETDPVIEVAAVTGYGEHPIAFLANGVFGGYFNTFDELPASAVRAEHVDRDGRNVRRFRLDLSDEQEARVLERLWELQRRGYYPYRFFSNNCAAYVAYVLGEEVSGPFVLPTGVLDALPVERVPEGFPSHRTVARRAEREQTGALEALVARIPPEHGEAWLRWMASARQPELSERRLAYQGLPALVEWTLALDSGAAPYVVQIVDAAVRMERYAAQEAENAAREVDHARLVLPPGTTLPTTEELIASRQQRFEREAGTDRLGESLRRYVHWARLLESLPRRAPTAEEIVLGEQAARARDVFLELTATYADLVDRHRSARPVGTMRERPWRKTRSGLGRFALGVQGLRAPEGAFEPRAVLFSAFLSERLGERRAHGLDPMIELRLLDSKTNWRFEGGAPRFDGMELDVVRVRTMPREPSLMRTSFIDHLGAGAGVTLRQDALGHQAYAAFAEALVPLAASEEYEHHLVLGLGPQVGAAGMLLPGEASVGARVALSARTELPTGWPASARLDLTWSPMWRALGGARIWSHEAKAQLHLEYARSPRAPIQVEFLLEAEWHRAGGASEHTVGAGIALGTP